tara:strand:- start:88 stop:651 length:564 start_codon:yes stop_codon:yes gene_type:complete
MKSKSRDRIRVELKKNEIKRKRIYAIQKRIALVGVFGLVILILLLLFGYLKAPNQKVETSFTFRESKKIPELISHFLTKVPTIDGEIASNVKITKQGAWINSSQNEFFTLIEANYRKGNISYNIYESEFGVTGNWTLQFSKKDSLTIIKIIENSLIDNLGQRALLYWMGSDRYCKNLVNALKKSLQN